jgi:acylphosphatase
VENAADGSVRGEVQGGADDVAVFMERMRSGPPRARVADFRAENCPSLKDEKRFEQR